MENRRKLSYLAKVIEPLLLALLIALSILSPGLGVTAKAATPPSLKIELGSPYLYSVKGKNPDSIKYGTATATTSVMDVSLATATDTKIKTITIQETENNKLYELGYVPIVTSLNVPAETTLYVTLTFTLEGKKMGAARRGKPWSCLTSVLRTLPLPSRSKRRQIPPAAIQRQAPETPVAAWQLIIP